MDIRRYHMNLMPSGEAYAGGGVSMRPRDFLKFGQMYLDGGVWKGRQIVSRAWVTRSTSRRIAAPNGSTDGFGWHRYTLTSGSRTYQEYEASGNGGQFLMVVPDLDLVVVMTGGNYGRSQASGGPFGTSSCLRSSCPPPLAKVRLRWSAVPDPLYSRRALQEIGSSPFSDQNEGGSHERTTIPCHGRRSHPHAFGAGCSRCVPAAAAGGPQEPPPATTRPIWR